MKNILKGIIVILAICIIATAFNYNASAKKNDSKLQKSISSKIIRFHVLANSDSLEDQQLKIKVKNKIIDYLQPRLEHSKSIAESRKILRKNDAEVKTIAFPF